MSGAGLVLERILVPVDGSTGGDAALSFLSRFPGAPDVATFWWNLCTGVDSIHEHTDEELAALGVGPGLRADPRHVRAVGRSSAS